VGELGAVTLALLAMTGGGEHSGDDATLAERICRACVEGLDVDGAALSLLTGTAAGETVWATDPVAGLVEELQFTLNEGVCMEAAATGAAVLVADLHDRTEVARWPMFAAAVLEQTPVSALFALPLRWGAVKVGVLDLYRVAPGVLSDAQCRDALAAADTAALMLLGLHALPAGPAEGAGSGDTWLDHLVDNRAEIHQATGLVIVQLRISATDALARLRAHAFSEQRLLIDVAQDVVAGRLYFTPEQG